MRTYEVFCTESKHLVDISLIYHYPNLLLAIIIMDPSIGAVINAPSRGVRSIGVTGAAPGYLGMRQGPAPTQGGVSNLVHGIPGITGGRANGNNPLVAPGTNRPVDHQYTLDRSYSHLNQKSQGQMVMVYRPENHVIPELKHQKHRIVGVSMWNYYARFSDLRERYKYVTEEGEIMKEWAFLGTQWTPDPPEGSAIARGSKCETFHIAHTTDTWDIWAATRTRPFTRSCLDSNITDSDSVLYLLLKRVKEENPFTNAMEDYDPKEKTAWEANPEAHYYWRLEPYHSMSILTPPYYLYNNENPSNAAENYHGRAIRVGVVDYVIHGNLGDDDAKSKALRAVYPTENTDAYIFDLTSCAKLHINMV